MSRSEAIPDAEASLPAVHALHLVEVVARFGVSAEALLEAEGLRAPALAEPDARLSIAAVERLVERARALTGEPGLGFYLGLQMRVSAHGFLGFAAMSAPTARDALELVARFSPTRTGVLGLSLREAGETAELVIEERVSLGTAEDVIVLALLLGIWQLGQALTGQALEGTAEAAFPAPAYLERFGPAASRIRFGQPAHRLVFPRAHLALPLTQADPAALKLARAQLERELDALSQRARSTVAARVRQSLGRDDGSFRPLEELAARLAMSPRTLKRRLAEEGTAYSRLLDDERRARAERLLGSPELTLDQVAERLGYSDPANFVRAFRRWTGQTPAAYRRTHRR